MTPRTDKWGKTPFVSGDWNSQWTCPRRTGGPVGYSLPKRKNEGATGVIDEECTAPQKEKGRSQ